MAQPASEDLRHSAVLRRIAMPACVAISVLVTLGVIHGIEGQSPPVIAAEAVALVVALGGIGWTLADQSGMYAPDFVGLTAAGLTAAGLAGGEKRAGRLAAEPWL
jgi:hypothetical protein